MMDTDDTAITPQDLAHMGADEIAYVRPMRSEEITELFPQAPHIEPGLDLFALVSADGRPIVLTDTREAAIANAAQNELTMVSVH